ncbi:hypothetical protein C8R47DRAFT_1050065 [Mycena vitilis]|nr:hypothetical protein C8R47DRAFT_1050065 [Mycena vitilis]
MAMLCESCKHPLLPPDALPTPKQTGVLLEYLRSSSVPRDPSGYQAAISASTAALVQYDSQIERLQETLRRMRADRTKLQGHIDGCRSVFSPVRRLPPEILCEIFASVPDHAEAWTETPADVAKTHLLKISEVCNHWHTLVIRTSKLWSEITIHPSGWTTATLARFLAALEMCLGRGRQHPLILSATLRNVSVSPPALEFLGQHSNRWQSVDFTATPDELHTLHVKGRVNLLEKISLCIFPAGGNESVVANTDIFLDAPRLKHVQFSSPPPVVSYLPKLPWEQLHMFGCPAPQRAEDLINIMALMPNLSHPDAAFELQKLNAYFLECPLHLPSIKPTISSLTFLVDVPRDKERFQQILAEIMGCLTLPQLRELHIRSSLTWNMSPWPGGEFQSLSSRSSFHNTLRVLEIPGVGIADDELVLSLTSLGSLERLIIADRPGYGDHNLDEHVLITDSLLLRLTCTHDTSYPGLVPQLNYIHCTSLCKFSTHVFFDFMASRVVLNSRQFETVVRCLKRASLKFEPDVRRKISTMVSEGVLKLWTEHL